MEPNRNYLSIYLSIFFSHLIFSEVGCSTEAKDPSLPYVRVYVDMYLYSYVGMYV